MKNFMLFCAFLISTNSGFGQKATLNGIVYDGDTGESLLAATVQIGDGGISTDLNGEFSIEIDPGTYEVVISYVGFENYTETVQLEAGETAELSAKMMVSDNLLKAAVVTGSKYERSLERSVVSIDLIRPNLIESTNTTNVEDVLSKIPGVQILDGQPNIRGGSGWAYNAGNRVMMLIDDLPALQPDAGRAQWNDVPVENIAQVEVIKGAGSTLYGSAAMNGVINIRTGYATSEPETRFSVSHIRYDKYADARKVWYDHTPKESVLTFSHKQKFGKLDVVAAAFHYRQDSVSAFRQEDFGHKTRGNLNLRYRATDRTTFGINTIVNEGFSSSFFLWKNGTTGALQPFAGTVTRSDNFRYTIDPYITHYDKHDNRHKLQSRIYYNRNDNNLNQSNTSRMVYNEYQFQRSFIPSGLNLTAGVVASFVNSEADYFSNADVTHNNYASYVQLDKSLGEDFNITGGLRYEFHEQSNGAITHSRLTVPEGSRSEGRLIGRVGANYSLTEGTFIRASWGQAYRYPILIERFLSTEFGGFVILPNPDLVSESGFSSEIGLKQGFHIGSFRGYFDVVGFLSRYENMMEFTFVTEPLFGFKSLNVGDTEISGYEVSIAANSTLFEVPITIYGGYNYINPKYQEFTDLLRETSSFDENVLKYRTRHSYTMDVQADYKNLTIGVGFQGASHVEAIDAILETFIPNLGSYREVNNAGFNFINFRVGYTLDRFKLSLHLKNAFNEEYTLRPGLIEAPRNLGIRVDYKVTGKAN